MSILELIEQLKALPEKMEGSNSEGEFVVLNTHKLAESLKKDLRNCDVGTAEEQEKRFNSFCKTHLSGIRSICSAQCPCVGCRSMFHCLTKWLQMPYEKGDEK